jgi:hypothetical protein
MFHQAYLYDILRVCKVVCVSGEVTSETSLHTQRQLQEIFVR